MQIFCCKCGELIPAGRLKALPNTKVCVRCSTTERVAGFRVISGKTSYTELQLVSQEKFKELKSKQERRGMAPGRGVWLDKR